MNKKTLRYYFFYPLETLVLLVLTINGYLILNTNYDTVFFYTYGMILGLISFIFFAIAITPGMLGRFGVRNKIITWLTVYRREFGKTMFLLALTHYLTIKIFPLIKSQSIPDFPLYQTIGFIALNLALLLFITSTDWAQKKLGLWWKRLHRLVYIIVWLIFLHVALAQGLTIISFIILLIAILETTSLAYDKSKK